MPTLQTYRALGPFDNASLPEGLKREHRLKQGSWALLTVLAGEIVFHWDDDPGARPVLVETGQNLHIPPERPHHLEPVGPFRLSIEFQREG